MEPAKIDWKRVEWNFVEDELYEHINAPKWVDFLSPDHDKDDEAWFCKPDCKHPKTAEDFLRSPSPFKKSKSPAYGLENSPFGDQNRRYYLDGRIKRRVPALSSASPPDDNFRFNLDSENQDPNMCTPSIQPTKTKTMKAAIKSSEEKRKLFDDAIEDSKVPPLRSVLSTKNLFAPRPILNHITEFYNELKKLTLRAREREDAENLSTTGSESVVQEKTPLCPFQPLGKSDIREKERKPLVEVKQQRKKPDEAENRPITLDLECIKNKREENLQQIRVNPPSPQCFSAAHGLNKTTPSTTLKSRLMEKGILKEVEPNKEIAKESSPSYNCRSIAVIDERETKTLDMFWFLKPCTLSS
ncbi:uncharacterized protein LOC130749183 isoform X2 [Lotus japonicus]|uniref:uncharacterized protein LOC130749183 isoform X2 n=1 Tax=Lotus japonicus TaxID=34305 RepID=UPI00258E3D1F|nr:uncharacterized protein LOC130749183 isoform X2 [Lotus japonicus]